jgi:Flp pilus assembly protein TadG
MLFEYSNHSLEQMQLRNISKEIVDLVMKQPDRVINEADNQQIFQKVIEQRLYRVFVTASKNPALIKTVYKTSKISKYNEL